VPPIEILPYPAVFISGFRDEQTSRTLEIVNHDTVPLNIVGLSRENAELWESYSAEFTTLEAGRRYRLNIELKSAERAGRSTDVMKVLTDHPRFPVIRIPVNMLVKDDVYINPESVDFGPITNQVAGQESFLLKARGRPIKVLSVTSDLPFVKVTPSRADTPALTHEFQVGMEGKVERGPFKGTISIRTDDPDFPELKAMVEGSVQ